jgi:hypothetical protein
MIINKHQLHSFACKEIGALEVPVDTEHVGIPEAHDIKAPFIELQGTIYEIIYVIVRPVIEDDRVEVYEQVEGIT